MVSIPPGSISLRALLEARKRHMNKKKGYHDVAGTNASYLLINPSKNHEVDIDESDT